MKKNSGGFPFADPAERKTRGDASREAEPSLLSDTLSAERHRSRLPVPLWAIAAAIFAVVIGLVLTVGPGGTSRPLVPTPRLDQSPPLDAETGPAAEEVSEPVSDKTPPEAEPQSVAVQPRSEAVTRPQTTPTPSPPAARPRTPRPRLVREEAPPTTAQPDPPAVAPGAATPATVAATPAAAGPPPALDPAAEQAFELLKNRSDPALRLTGGLIEGLDFAEWRMAGKRGEAYLIDLVAAAPDGRVLHLVWAVDPTRQSVQALSQAARDLEARANP